MDAPDKDPTAGNGKNKMHDGQKQEYVKYMKAQLRELIKNYDPAVLWFDGEWVDWWTEEDGQDLYAYVREPEACHHRSTTASVRAGRAWKA